MNADAIQVGIDMEQLNRLSPNLWQRVFRDEECDTLASLGDTPLVDAAFSAKEAVFKAVNPSVGEYIPFHDVSIEFEGDARFTAVYHGHDRRNRCMLTGRGVWRIFGHHVFTLFYIK